MLNMKWLWWKDDKLLDGDSGTAANDDYWKEQQNLVEDGKIMEIFE